MDDLENNPLYKAFSTEFRNEFNVACQRSYVMAIPHSECLQDVVIDQHFANSHILAPSKLLKMHYVPIQLGWYDDIEIEGKKLVCRTAKQNQKSIVVINILAEEIGYNVYQKEFRTILIDRSLVNLSDRASRLSFSNILAPLAQANFGLRRSSSQLLPIRPKKPLKNHSDCADFLESLSQDVISQLELDVKRLQSNYLFLPQYLNDAFMRIRNLADIYVGRFESSYYERGQKTVCDSTRRAISVSVDNYIIHLLHGKLMTSIHQQHEKDDDRLMKNFKKITRSNLSICQLGAQEAFGEFSPSEDMIQLLSHLPYEQSPLSIVSCIIRLADLVNEGLDQSVKFKHLLGDRSHLLGEDRVTICSDDLIATFVYLLAQAKPNHLFSVSRYLDIFGCSSIARDQAAYYTATFQLVVQYIYNFETSDGLPNDCDPQISDESPIVTAAAAISAKLIDLANVDIDSKSADTGFTDSIGSRISAFHTEPDFM